MKITSKKNELMSGIGLPLKEIIYEIEFKTLL